MSTQNKSVSRVGLLILVSVSMLFWGLGWPSGKVLTRYCSPLNFAVYRYILVLSTLLPALFFMRIRVSLKREGIGTVLLSGVLLAIYSYLFYMGLKYGTPGAGGILFTTLNPLIAYALGIFTRKKAPGKYEAMGLAIGLLAGVVQLRVWDRPGSILDSGNFYLLLAAFVWAFMSLFTARASKYGTSGGFSFWQYLVTLICLLPLADWQEARHALTITAPLFWINLIFSSVLVTTVATTIYFYTTTRLGPARAGSFIFMVPLFAGISSWWLMGEQLQVHTLLGGTLGIAAVYLINRKPGQPKPAADARKG